jgi:hypothetical protein
MGPPVKKLALGHDPTPVSRPDIQENLFFMAFGAVSIVCLAEGFFTVMADAAMFILAVGRLGHFQVFFFHLENLRVAIGTFQLLLVHMKIMGEENRPRASFGFKFYIPAPHFLLSEGHP